VIIADRQFTNDTADSILLPVSEGSLEINTVLKVDQSRAYARIDKRHVFFGQTGDEVLNGARIEPHLGLGCIVDNPG
jgi:hypothetical protein